MITLAPLGGCGDGEETSSAVTTTTVRGPRQACGPPPTSSVHGVRETFLPAGAVVTDVVPAADRTTIEAYVPQTPVQLRAEYEGRPELKVLESEDEGHEAELLVSDGTRRAAIKAEVVCRSGSSLRLVIAPEQATSSTTSP